MLTSPTLPNEPNSSNHRHTRIVPLQPCAHGSLRTHSHTPSGCYFFENCTSRGMPSDLSSYNGKPIQAPVPLIALLSGAPIPPRIVHAPCSILKPGSVAGDPFPTPVGAPPTVVPSSSIKHVLTSLLPIAKKLVASCRIHLLRQYVRHGLTNSRGQRIVAMGSVNIQDRFSISCALSRATPPSKVGSDLSGKYIW